ncbi:MAG: nuclear transport factor 2 family protein [Aquabacterium sp.]|nr:nuclear transport factor 2 family protein [Aquabacterium sp.]
MPTSPVIDAWHHLVQHRDMAALQVLLADDVVFHGPVVHTPQRGKDVTTQCLTVAVHVPNNASSRSDQQIIGSHAAVLEFSTTSDGIDVSGIDLTRWNDASQITDFKGMVRPLKAVNMPHQQMGALLDRLKQGQAQQLQLQRQQQ